MILFWSLAAVLTAAALLFLLPPLLRPRSAAPDVRVAANAALYREQLEELAAELRRGAISPEEYRRASHEIERRIIAEHAAGGPPGEPRQGARQRPLFAAALAIGLGLPVLAGLAYWQLGNPDGVRNVVAADASHQVTGAQMEALVEKLAARMEQKPDDADGWALLGRSLNVLGQHERSAAAYARAAKLSPQDPNVLADYADALAMARGRKLEGEPLALVKRALAVDPDHIKALALAGTAEFERRNYKGAIAYWERIQKNLPPDSEFARSVADSVAEARALSGKGPAPQAAKSAKPAEPRRAAGASIAGTVSLDPKIAALASPGDTVFILARPASGQRMPLAVARVTVAQLPYAFSLDDSMAMAPGATISSHAQVMVIARVSKAGSAAPQKGDIEGAAGPVAPGASGLKIVLSRVID